MTRAAPPRLRDDAELGGLLRAAADDVPSAERLTRVGRTVRAAVAATPAAPAAAPGAKLALIGAGFALVVGAAIGASGRDPDERAVIDVAALDREEAARVAPAVATPVVPAEPPALRPTAVPARHAAGGGDRAMRARRPQADPPRGDLAEQIERYDRARGLARRGEHVGAIAALDELTRRFPDSPLADEAALSRAEWLARAGRTREAIAAFERLLAADRYPGRAAELSRVLGDLRRRAAHSSRRRIVPWPPTTTSPSRPGHAP
jgi:hypothetical protein